MNKNTHFFSSFIESNSENKREEEGDLEFNYYGCFGFAICKINITKSGFFNIHYGKSQINDYRIQTTGTHSINDYKTLEHICDVPEGCLLNGYEKDLVKFKGGTLKNKNYYGNNAEYWHKDDILWCISQDINKEKVLPRLSLIKFNEDQDIPLKKGNKVFLFKGTVDINDSIFTHETRRQIKVVSGNVTMSCLSNGYAAYVS